MALGIKNSWKYEKDLIILLNKKFKIINISKMANILLFKRTIIKNN